MNRFSPRASLLNGLRRASVICIWGGVFALPGSLWAQTSSTDPSPAGEDSSATGSPAKPQEPQATSIEKPLSVAPKAGTVKTKSTSASSTKSGTVTAKTQTASPPPWAASSMNLSQSVSLLSFDRSAELDYNPYYALTLGLAPHWRWHPKFYTSASLSFSREITQPDGRNRPDDIWLSDTKLTLGTPGWTIPVVDITVGGRVTSAFATSPASQAQTLNYGLETAFSLSRRFALLGGLNFGYSGSFRTNFHEFTTGELEAPRVPACRGQTCAELIGTGVRNTQYQQAHSASVSLTILPWMSVSTSFGVYLSHLYPEAEVDGVSQETLEPIDTRYAVSYGMGLGLTPAKGVSTTLGLSTFNPQRTPDNQYYEPYVNRYSQVYLDLRLTPGAWFE